MKSFLAILLLTLSLPAFADEPSTGPDYCAKAWRTAYGSVSFDACSSVTLGDGLCMYAFALAFGHSVMNFSVCDNNSFTPDQGQCMVDEAKRVGINFHFEACE